MTDLEDGTIARPEAYAALVAANVRAAMGAQKVSATALATRLGCSARWLQRRASGEVELTTAEVEWISLALGVPLSTLVDPT